MKKIKLIISLLIINFSVYSQTIPTAEQFLNFLKENNYTCNSIDYEELYSNYGYDVEDDVSELRDAIDDFCECYLPSYFEEYDIISSKKKSLIKLLKDNSFEDFQMTSVLTLQTFKNAGFIPKGLKFKAFPEKIIIDFKVSGLSSNLVGDTTSYPLIKTNGLDVPGYTVSQEHDLFKTLDDFKAGDKTKSKIWIDLNDDLIKNSYYEIVYEKVDDERIWSITEFKKEVNCRYSKNNCGECEDKVDTAYVIATNVNIRNKPNVSESKVLFQLNKVVWYKDTLNFGNESDYLQTDWLSFPAKPIEIIDSAITNGNKWYKIKGAKLIKEEANDLSKWGDWDLVRDSFFNLDDNGYIIRENYDGEHWIYHTLVHRFQNNSLKDGKYSASKVAEASYKKVNYKNVNDYVNFTID